LKNGSNNATIKVFGHRVTVARNVDVTITNSGNWHWNGSSDLKMTGGTSSAYVTLELTALDFYGEWDLGWPLCAMGYGGEVIIGAGAHVKGVDNTDNPTNLTCGDCCITLPPGVCSDPNNCHGDNDCLMVTTLTFESGSSGKYKKNGLHLHYQYTNAAIGQIEN